MSVLIPSWIIPEDESYDFMDESSVVFNPEFAPGLAQRQSFGGLRLKVSRTHIVRQDEMGLLVAMLKATRGAYGTMYSRIHYQNRGALGFAQLLTNSSFDGTTGWTSSDTGQAVIAEVGRVLRSRRVAAASSPTLRNTSFTTVNGARYAARAFVSQVRGVIAYQLRLGTSAGGSELLNGLTVSAQTLSTGSAAATGTTTHFSIVDVSTGRLADYIQDIVYTSVSRCFLVNGSGQAGSQLNVDGLPASTDELLAFGDWIEINGELKRVTVALTSDSTGAGVLTFEPPLVRSPLDNDPIIVTEPMGKFIVSNIKEENMFGMQARVSYDMEHIYE